MLAYATKNGGRRPEHGEGAPFWKGSTVFSERPSQTASCGRDCAWERQAAKSSVTAVTVSADLERLAAAVEKGE
jgi:hypothetical protein